MSLNALFWKRDATNRIEYMLPCSLPRIGVRLLPSAEQYACPKCGHHWAGFEPSPTSLKVHYHFRHMKCPDCGGGTFRIFGNYPLSDLPYEALLEEVDLILKTGDRYDVINWY